ncbi:DUF2452 domain-containing protein [Arhodomonas aquaeolei]|uniref:DUF2452 domain-containing protein n=1 Tax=Arhodomonas aquaeolei TaxID=2369 RepID=UPI0021682143|nr:DUF2452 domain-containing protein [Arhodomonas aquaeolei]MCS4505452.1 DUF2452 domain-containing protein [Arhodomonas aquaeolei]
MSKNPNPQGKGGAPVLATLEAQRAAVVTVPPKHIEQVSTELFTSLFVLESDFRFRPVPGKRYYLYRKPERYWLSMIPPQEWGGGEAVTGRFIGACELQPDMTWTLELDEAVAADDAFMNELAERRAAFERQLGDVEAVDDVLPVHERRFTFYRRAFAFALAHSLGRSMEQSGIAGLSYEEAQGRLAHESGEADR